MTKPTLQTGALVVLLLCVFAGLLPIRTGWVAEAKPDRIGLILATGGLGDQAFNDMSYAGALRAARELPGVPLDFFQPMSVPEYRGFQRAYALSGEYRVIVCIGFDQADSLYEVAAEFPDQQFVIVDQVVDQPNVASLLFKASEGGFLLGVVASHLTRTGLTGLVGGMDIPLIRDFFVGFKAGVKWAGTGAQVLPPQYVGFWNEPALGRERALDLIDQGSDVIWAIGARSGTGALEAAGEAGILGLGVDICQCSLVGGGQVVASMTKRVDQAVYEQIMSAFQGAFQPGVMEGGVAEGWVGLCRFPAEQAFWEEMLDFTHPWPIPPEALEQAEKARDLIARGEIRVPRPPEFGEE